MEEQKINDQETMVAVSATIKQKHKTFLENNPDINFSGLVRKWIDKEVEKRNHLKLQTEEEQ